MTGRDRRPEQRPIDLGLPSGVRWAEMNLGSRSYEDPGLYTSWGNIFAYRPTSALNFEGVYEFTQSNYETSPASAISGNITTEYDVAHELMGGRWRIPSRADYEELVANCDISAIVRNGRAGILCVSLINGQSVFIPCTGYAFRSTLYSFATMVRLWLTDGTNEQTSKGIAFNVGESSPRIISDRRYLGFAIRPVLDPE